MGPFERFSDKGKRVLATAQNEAIRLRHNYIGTEHLLLGLVREGEGPAASALTSLGVDLAKCRTAVEFIIGVGQEQTAPSDITLSPRTKKVIELAIDEARKLGHDHVGPEHILLGLAREGEGIASGVLESLGASMDVVRQRVFAALGRSDPTPGATTAGRAQTMRAAIARHQATYEVAGPLDRLDEDARRVVALAQNESLGLSHTWVGTEHLLLGLILANGTAAQRALAELGVGIAAAREHVAKAVPPGVEWQTATPSFTPRMQSLVATAAIEARGGPTTPERLLLALVADQAGVGAQVLAALGATPQKVSETLDRLTPPAR